MVIWGYHARLDAQVNFGICTAEIVSNCFYLLSTSWEGLCPQKHAMELKAVLRVPSAGVIRVSCDRTKEPGLSLCYLFKVSYDKSHD